MTRRNFVDLFDRAVSQAEERRTVRGTLGRVERDGTRTLRVDDRPGWCYVSVGPVGDQAVTTARNVANVPLRPGLPVKLRRVAAVLAIVAVDRDQGLLDDDVDGDTNDYGVLPHSHAPGSGLEFDLALGELVDVAVTDPATGELLTYDAASGTWINLPPAGAPVHWVDIEDVPTTFPPAAHTHPYAPDPHTHDYAATTHTHPYAATTHTHPYVAVDGTTPLTGDWDLGEDRRIRAEALRARDAEGLRLENSAGNLGLLVSDGGHVGVNTTDPDGFEVDAAVTEVLQGRNNARLGIRLGSPRLILEEVTSGVQWQVDNNAGVFRYFTPGNVALALTTAGRIGSGTAVGVAPQGKLHLHDGTGGLIFVTVTGINSTTATVIIPNGTGDMPRGCAGLLVATDATVTTATSFSLLTPDTLDVTVGSVTLRLELLSSGQLQVKRLGGTGTGTLALLGIWL